MLYQLAMAASLQGAQYVHDAKISLKAARALALRAVPGGRIVDQELEREPGGSGLRFSFDVKSGKVVREVGVDAKTGKILENSVEGAHPD